MSESTTTSTPAFSKLGPRQSLYTPPNPATGELIILCSWLGAAKKHVSKYISGYLTLAPRAKILLIESSVLILTSAYPTQWKAIQPSVSAVRAVLEECEYGTPSSKVKPKIILHTFSNGGTNSATQLLIVLNRALKRPIPLHGILCDSGPAAGGYWKSYNAMVLSLPKGVLTRQVIGPLVIQFILIVLYASILIGRYEAPETTIRRTLLDEKFVDNKRIAYVFSTADKMVDWTDIVGHGDEAEEKGMQVKQIMYEDTPHCNHFSKHGDEYLEVMDRVWNGKEFGPRTEHL